MPRANVPAQPARGRARDSWLINSRQALGREERPEQCRASASSRGALQLQSRPRRSKTRPCCAARSSSLCPPTATCLAMGRRKYPAPSSIPPSAHRLGSSCVHRASCVCWLLLERVWDAPRDVEYLVVAWYHQHHISSCLLCLAVYRVERCACSRVE